MYVFDICTTHIPFNCEHRFKSLQNGKRLLDYKTEMPEFQHDWMGTTLMNHAPEHLFIYLLFFVYASLLICLINYLIIDTVSMVPQTVTLNGRVSQTRIGNDVE